MSRCGICSNWVNSKKPAISCGGSCEKQYHLTCVEVPNELLSYLKDVPGVSWKCKECSELPDLFDGEKLQAIFEERVNQFFGDLNDLFLSMRADFFKRAESKLNDFQLPLQPPKIKSTYSSVLCSQPAIVVKPKVTQQNIKTKSDILQNLKPMESDINIKKIKHVKDGGLLLSCQTADETSRFKCMAQEKLSTDYIIREVKGHQPRIKIVGLSEKLEPDTLCNLMLKQNNELFSDTSNCKLIKLWPTKNNRERFQAIVQLQGSDYDKILDNGYLLIGLDICKVFSAVDILRCYKCNGFNHSSRSCRNTLSCPKCSLNHEIGECKSDKLKCINCCTMVKRTNNSDINTEHATWDRDNCYAYKDALDKLKSDLGYK